MAHREVTDADGVTWDVWDVHPDNVESRSALASILPARDSERRVLRTARSRLSPGLHGGWLAMRTATERRRVVPIPDGWFRLSDDELRALVAGARRVGAAMRSND